MKRTLRHNFERLKTGWYIWLFPLAAIGISAYLFLDYYSERGTRILIHFEDAAGIHAEKTTVRFRGVSIGTVKDVYLSDDQKNAVVEVLLRKDSSDIAVEGSRFSLVTPKVNLQGISGLNTLFEGEYISVLPGPQDGASRTEFKAQMSTAATDPLDDTTSFLLETDNVESVNAGDSISYRGVKIGSVTKLFFDKTGQAIDLQVNIENRFVRLIRANTVFWRKVGIDAKLGLFHSEIKVNSLETLMNGGIEVATPEVAGPRAKPGQRFQLASAAPKEYGKWRPTLQ